MKRRYQFNLYLLASLLVITNTAAAQILDGTGRAQSMLMEDGKSFVKDNGDYVAYHELTEDDTNAIEQRFNGVNSALETMVAEMTDALAPDRDLIKAHIAEQQAIMNEELQRTRRARDLAIKAAEDALFSSQLTKDERDRAEAELARTVAARRQAENLENATRTTLSQAENLRADAYDALVRARNQRNRAEQLKNQAVASANQATQFASQAQTARNNTNTELTRTTTLRNQAQTAATEANAAKAAAEAASAAARVARGQVGNSASGIGAYETKASQAASTASQAASNAATVMNNAQNVLVNGANSLNGKLGGYNTRMNNLVNKLNQLGM